MAQEERARRNVEDADDEDDHFCTEACEGFAKKMFKYLEDSEVTKVSTREHVSSDMLRLRGPARGAEGSVALLKESTQLGCVSQDSHPRESMLREEGKFGSKRAVKFSKAKCELHERNLCAPQFGERSHEEALIQERCARKVAWDSANKITSSRMRTKLRFTLLLKQEKCRHPLRKVQWS